MKQSNTSRFARSTYLFVFFLLVASSVVAIIGTIGLSYWITSSYADAVETNRHWAGRLELLTELQTIADNMNAPGNDVFASGDPQKELVHQKLAHQKLLERQAAIRDGILKGLPPSQDAMIRDRLVDAIAGAEEVNAQGELTLQAFATGDSKRAGANMAAMDQSLRKFVGVADALEGTIRKLQLETFDVQAQRAAHARHIEKWIGLGIVALVIWLGIYGQKLYRMTIDVADSLEDAMKQAASARNAADAANSAKSAFLANMSHEIRTPITAIVGFSEMMLDPDQTLSDRFDGLQTIRRNSQHLLALINDILDISKIEAGKMKVERIECDLPLLLGEVMSMLQPRALEKGLDFRLQLDTPIPRKITTDPLRLRQVLVNLLGNAMKFTAKGKVEIHVAQSPADGHLDFSVIDSGIGMTDEQVSRLFEPFTQADGSTTRRFGGSGLGLTISKRLAQMLGGEIVVSSQHGKGSTFKASIDSGATCGPFVTSVEETVLQSQDALAKAETGNPMLHARVLLAEDGVDNQRFISAMLRKAGAEVVIAENGKIAVELALSQTFDLVFMDMQMPEMDGYAATSKLRSRGCRLPIIALTAHAMAEDRAKCIQAGCTDYLTKPIDRKKLIQTVAKYLTVPAAETADHATVTSAGFAQNPPEKISMNKPKLISTFADDPAMSEILPEYVANLREHVNRIEELVAESRADELRTLVHQIKGAGGTYGFAPLTTAAAHLESRLKSGEAVAAVQNDIELLLQLIRSVDGFDSAEIASGKESGHAKSADDR